MSTNPTFSAASSAAGYYYQARLALAEALRFAYLESGVEIAIERLDDVSFEKDGQPLELLQTKHHISKVADLTDASVDLWKTLRVWSDAVRRDPSLPGRTRFALITTANAPDGSAASYLRPDLGPAKARDVAKAEALLTAAAESSTNAALKSAFDSFQNLTAEMQTSLLSAVEVLDRAPVLVELDAILDERLKMIAPRGKAATARTELEGWWWPRICKALLEPGVGAVAIAEVEAKLDDIRELMKRDALPTEMEHAEPPEAALQALDEMPFVRQLRTVGIGSARIEYAKRDYYRAFTQRSRWTRENLLFDGEVTTFETRLVEEWQPRFHSMCDSLDPTAEDAAIRNAGQKLYYWMETEARFPFRTVSARFISVGSYHMLANAIRIGWHRDYAAFFAHPEENSNGCG